jgi:hypothetical protein
MLSVRVTGTPEHQKGASTASVVYHTDAGFSGSSIDRQLATVPCHPPERPGAPLGIVRGPDVALIVRARAAQAGLNPAELTGAACARGSPPAPAATGASVPKIMETTRHKSVDILAARARRVDLFKDHAGAAFL